VCKHVFLLINNTSIMAQQQSQMISLSSMSGRRAFLASSVITTLVGVGFAPAAHAKLKGKKVDYKAVAGDIASIIKDDPNKGPTLVRLAWSSSGTYDGDL
jgi:catalase (peroxidase I)